MSDLDLSEHAARNRAGWNADAPNWAERVRADWVAEPNWGMWNVPESELQVLPDVRGLYVIDLGCGTGYWCSWLARMGAFPTGLDVSERQLETAADMQREHGI